MTIEWASLFELRVSAIELIVRGSLMYWFLFLVFRFVLPRNVGAVGIADILLLVLIADASQSAMAGSYETVAEGAVLVATLAGWNYLLDWAAFRWEAVRRFAEPQPLLLVRRGRLMHRNLRAEHITLDELKAHLHANGLVSWEGVRAAYLEGDGSSRTSRKPAPTAACHPSRARRHPADLVSTLSRAENGCVAESAKRRGRAPQLVAAAC